MPTVSAIANITLAEMSSAPTAASGAIWSRLIGDGRRSARTTHDQHGDRGGAVDRHRPQRAVVGREVRADEERAEAERRHDGEADAGRRAAVVAAVLERGERGAGQRQRHAERLRAGRRVAGGEADDDRQQRGHRRDRRHDAHRADGERLVERGEADQLGNAGARGQQRRVAARQRRAGGEAATPTSTSPVACETSRTHRRARRRVLRPARKSEAPQARLAPRARATGTMAGTLAERHLKNT